MSRTYRRQKGDRTFADVNGKNVQNGWHFTPLFRLNCESWLELTVDSDGCEVYVRRREYVVMNNTPRAIEDRTRFIRAMQLDGVNTHKKWYKKYSAEKRRLYAKKELSRLNKIASFEEMDYNQRGCDFYDNWYY